MRFILNYSVRSLIIAILFLLADPLNSIAEDGQPAIDGQPNILFIFADDHCYDSIHATGNNEIQTPSIDRIARAGTRFTHAHNMGSWSGAVCVASRRMLNSGRFVWNAEKLDLEMEKSAGRTWSQQMGAAGYETYFTGKWHVSLKPDEIFDHIGTERPGMPAQTPAGYERPVEGENDDWSPYDKSKGGYWAGGKHWSEIIGDEAVGFLDQASHKDDPFFMYIAFNAPHDPRQSPKEFVDKYPLENISIPVNFLPEYPYKDAIGNSAQLRDENLAPFPRTHYAVKVNRQEYYAIITHMDQQIGRILDALEKSGKADNTFVFFTADHGLAVGHHGFIGKQNLYEHSVRVPFFVTGPGVAVDKDVNTRIYLQDVMPTTMELAGIEQQEFVQFKSLKRMLGDDNPFDGNLNGGNPSEQYDSIYGAYLDLQRMVIKGDMKLILYPTIKKTLLYNLHDDPFEMHDLADSPEQSATIKSLFSELLKLQKETGDELDLKSVYKDLTEK